MEYSKVKKLYEDQVDNINKLFNNKGFINVINKNDLSKTNFLDQISIIKFLEKKLTDTKLIEAEIKEAKKKKKKVNLIDISDLNKFDEFFKKYKEIFGFGTPNEFEDIKKTEEIKDSISYFNVYLKNTYKHDLKYYLDGDNNKENETFEAERISDSEFMKDNSKKDNSMNSQDNTFSNQNPFNSKNPFTGFGQSFGFGQGDGTYEDWKRQNILRLANIQFTNEVKNGTFYLYQDKPKIFLILKKLFGATLVLVSISWLLVFISQMVIAISQSKSSSNLWYGQGNQIQFVTFSNQNIFNFIINLLIIFYLGFLGVKNLKNSKNQNELFGFDKRAAILLILLIVIDSSSSIISLVGWFTNESAIKSFEGGTYQGTYSVTNTTTALKAFDITIWSTVSGLILFAILLIIISIVWIYSPKIDVPRVNLKMEQLIKSIEESGQFSQK